MSNLNNYPEYAAIEHHIRRAHIERVVPLAEAIAGFIVDSWRAIQEPPRPAAVIIDGHYPWAGIKGRRRAALFEAALDR